jgi:hypothetical protein
MDIAGEKIGVWANPELALRINRLKNKLLLKKDFKK